MLWSKPNYNKFLFIQLNLVLNSFRPVRRADNLTTFMCRLSWNLGASTSWNPQGLSRPVMGLLYLFNICRILQHCWLQTMSFLCWIGNEGRSSSFLCFLAVRDVYRYRQYVVSFTLSFGVLCCIFLCTCWSFSHFYRLLVAMLLVLCELYDRTPHKAVFLQTQVN
jgi:hypothetical protein